MNLSEYMLISTSYCTQCRYSEFLKSNPLNVANDHIPCKECVSHEILEIRKQQKHQKTLNGPSIPLMFEPLQARDIGLKYE